MKYTQVRDLIITRMAALYPYLLLFFVVLFIFSFLFSFVNDFIHWKALLVCLFLFMIVCLPSRAGRIAIKKELRERKLFWEGARQGRLFISRLLGRAKSISRGEYLKAFFVFGVVMYVSDLLGALDLVVLAYALASVLFRFDHRISAVVVLALLAMIPFVSVIREDSFAERLAIYAYYFLVITAITKLCSIKKEEKGKDY